MTVRRSARVAAQKKASTPVEEPPKKKSKTVKKESPLVELKQEIKEEEKPLKKLTKLTIGDEIPELTLRDQDDNEIDLTELAKEKKILVIFAYPRASTPGCTRQACGFRDTYSVLKEKATVIGLSADSVKAQKNFETKQKLPYKLLSDPKYDLIAKLGFKKTPSGIIRSYLVFVDGKLEVCKIGVSPELSVSGAKEDVARLSKD